jgi:hypothetical protein
VFPNPWQTPQQSGKAVASLVLGIVSVMCCAGPITGIPAIIFGLLGRRDIARSEGQMDGSGLAVAGIVTGMIGTFGFLVYVVVYASIFLMATSTMAGPTYHPPPTATPYYGSPYGTPGGTIKVSELKASDGALKAQLARQATDAASRGHRAMVMTVSAGCIACAEIEGTFADFEMRMSLERVDVVKVDVGEFSKELRAAGLDKGKNLPWFFLLDASGNVTDSMSADEWDDNRPENIAPCMTRFLNGTLMKKRSGRLAPDIHPNIDDIQPDIQ